MSEHGLKQGKGCCRVVAKEDFRANHRLPRFNEGGEMENAIEGPAGVGGCDKETFNRVPVCHFALYEIDARW
jgi:hypothetical protein